MCYKKNKQLNLSRPLFTAQNLEHQSYQSEFPIRMVFDSVWQWWIWRCGQRRFLRCSSLHCSISLLLLKDIWKISNTRNGSTTGFSPLHCMCIHHYILWRLKKSFEVLLPKCFLHGCGHVNVMTTELTWQTTDFKYSWHLCSYQC